ncbi:hypothetical protein GCM10011607_28730 [Shewanella inventionis]|uniref:Uncharacterized protein n=1 Tax=Shewanella inventionis TaxID=1738770 RepID=A0ABQ1JHC1_9GAMM|nr:hypothetical protein [Shewanella inventionis]GGB66335.1 hypothetical protein GCM10011607_28730 [Shewanella inventionis]
MTTLLNTSRKESLKAFHIMAAQEQILETRRNELNSLLCNQQHLTKEEVLTLTNEREIVTNAHALLKAYCSGFEAVYEALGG